MITYKIFGRGIFVLILTILFILPNFAQQNLTQPRASQQASVSQRVGLTDIAINYHRPGVNGREIWGKLVPYEQVWRAGANENTTISFSTRVNINGVDVPAGTSFPFIFTLVLNEIVVFSFAPARQTSSYGTSVPQTSLPFTPGL